MQRVAIGRALVRRPEGDADGRADRRARRQAARGACAPRSSACIIKNGSTTDLCHARPGRGDVARRPHRHHARGRAAAGRHADGGLSLSGQPVRRPVRRQPGDEHRRRRQLRPRRRRGRRSRVDGAATASPSRASCSACSTAKAGSGDLALGIRPEGVLVARERRPGYVPVEAHIIEPLGAYDIVDLKVGAEMLRARTTSGFVGQARRHGLGPASTRRRRISSTRQVGNVARASGSVTDHGAYPARRTSPRTSATTPR